ncbi:methyltransferase FkbM family [Desulfitobacterium hafniense DCB-2]|uniref:Methyltransferase FkbM family n=1 Tax=Desulfitobacterium hafniense (strain DSM 10664 / DCB-2) TaxID=272564 RepID=B8FTU5_DESHD|nr:FkbM family methyltransferase [Desulfitobacterium hafniense]ACL22187.1 methyltransferase FkbM family [Desulfitobacterium hafniense DCB-2]
MNKLEAKRHVLETLNMPQCYSYDLSKYIDVNEPVIIYGAGNVGKHTGKIFKEKGIIIYAFLDRMAIPGQLVLDIPVYLPDDNILDASIRKKANVFIAISFYPDEWHKRQEIIEYLKHLGYENISFGYSHLSSLCVPQPFSLEAIDIELSNSGETRILRALDLLQDDHSRSVFASNLRAHRTFDYDLTVNSYNTIQYFKPDVPLKKGYSRFVDCGAMNGDSLVKLLNYYNCDEYYAFEANIKIYDDLSKTVDELKGKIKEKYMTFPLGVGKETNEVNFNIRASGLSYCDLEESKEVDLGYEILETDKIKIVRLDDVLMENNIVPTMIKMDIEGSEIDAIKGCQKIIVNAEPDLAICVYHKVADLWEIPLLLYELVPNYQFYLRSHHLNTWETVLYATL